MGAVVSHPFKHKILVFTAIEWACLQVQGERETPLHLLNPLTIHSKEIQMTC